MKKKSVIYVIIIILISTSLIAFSSLAVEKSNTQKEKEQFSAFIIENSTPLIFNGISQAETIKKYYLDPEIGKIENLMVENGQQVKKSEVIAVYNNSLIKEEVEKRSANLETLRVSVNNALENLNNVEEKIVETQSEIYNFKKRIKHYEQFSNNEKILEFESKIEQSQSELEILEESNVQAHQLLKETNLAFSIESKDIEDTKKKIKTSITSPIDGVVYVNQEGIEDSSIPFAEVVSPKTIIEGTVTEYDYENIKTNKMVTVKSLNQSIETKGEIFQVNPLPNNTVEEGSSSNYSFLVKTDENIHYGYNVQISLDLNQMKMPKEAMIKEGNDYFVYKYFDNRVHKTKISVKEINGEYIVTSGLLENSKIISNPDESLSDKKEVEINVTDE